MEETKKPNKNPIELFFYFFRIGFFVFGGGTSMVGQMQKDYVDKKKWLTGEELLDIVSVGRSLPGIMITNVACLFGYQMAGTLGALLSVLGMTLPSVIVLVFVTYFYVYFQQAVWFTKIMMGVRAAIVPVIFVAGLQLAKSVRWSTLVVILFVLAFILSLTDFSRPLIILLCGAIAFIYFLIRKEEAQ